MHNTWAEFTNFIHKKQTVMKMESSRFTKLQLIKLNYYKINLCKWIILSVILLKKFSHRYIFNFHYVWFYLYAIYQEGMLYDKYYIKFIANLIKIN